MINQLCCAALVLALVFACLLVIVWAFCHVAARSDARMEEQAND